MTISTVTTERLKEIKALAASIESGNGLFNAAEIDGITAELLAVREAQSVAVEEWRDVEGADSCYSVSSMGRVRSNRSGKYLSTNSLAGAGYVKVDFSVNGNKTQTTMHRAVAEAFIERPDGAGEVNHINGVKTDNRVENLQWVTRSENVMHGYYQLGNNVNPVIAEPKEGNGPSLHFKSVCAAGEQGFNTSHIYACLRGDYAQYKGYIWRSGKDTNITAPPAPAVPAGFKLVPVELLSTASMLIDLCRTHATLNSGGTYNQRVLSDCETTMNAIAILVAAAPTPTKAGE